MAETPDLGTLIADVVAHTRGGIHVAVPAQVVSYDAARQACTVKPTVSGRYHDPDTDALLPFPLPTIANVPVAFPSSAGFAITWPLSAGDTVLLVIADRSLDEWKSTGAAENVPQDTRRFDLTDAVAIPALRSFARPIQATGFAAGAMVLEGADVRLGSSAATDFVAMAAKVAAELAKLVTVYNAHTHSAVGGSTGTPSAPMATPSSVAATRVKAV